LKFFYTFTALIILTPLAALVIQGAAHQSDIFAFLVRTVLDDVLINSFLIVTFTSIGVVTFGVSCAWLNVHYHYFGKKVIAFLLMMPVVFPAYVLAYVYTDFFDAAGAFAQSLDSVGLSVLLPDIRSVWGACFVLTFCLYPYVYIFARNGFLSGSQSQIESGSLLGAGRLSQFFDIALPASRPFIMVGLMLVIMEILADYGTMDYFGIKVFSTVVYDAWAGYGDITAAARLSVLLLFFVFMLVWFEKTQRRKMRFYSLETAKAPHQKRSRGSLIFTAWCMIPITFGFLFPMFILLGMAFDGQNIDAIKSQAFDTLPFLWNSLSVCLIAALICVGLSFILTSYKRGHANRFNSFLLSICGFGYALPGVILGLGLLLVSFMFTQFGVLITGTFIFLIVGYLIRFLNISLQGLEAGYAKISPSIDQASRIMGSKGIYGALYDAWKIKLPLLLPAIMSAMLLISVEVIKELPLTLILRPFDFDTLAVRTYNLASDERLAEAAFPALFIVLAGCIPIIILHGFMRRSQ